MTTPEPDEPLKIAVRADETAFFLNDPDEFMMAEGIVASPPPNARGDGVHLDPLTRTVILRLGDDTRTYRLSHWPNPSDWPGPATGGRVSLGRGPRGVLARRLRTAREWADRRGDTPADDTDDTPVTLRDYLNNNREETP